MKGAARATALLVALVLAGWLAGAAGPHWRCAGSAPPPAPPAGYLLSAQNGDGGFGTAPGQSSSPLCTAAGRRSGWRRPVTTRNGRQPIRASLIGVHPRQRGQRRPTPARSSGRSSCGGPPALSATRSAVGSGRRARARHPRERLGLRPGQPHLVRGPGATGRRRRPRRRERSRGWSRQQDHDGGFNFADRRRRERRRRHRRRARGARRSRGSAGRVTAPRGRRSSSASRTATAAFPSEPRRGFERSIDRVGDPGPARRRCRPGSLHRAARRRCAYLSSLIAADGHVRYSRVERPDAGVGDGEALMALAAQAAAAAPPVAPATRRRRRRLEHARPSAHARPGAPRRRRDAGGDAPAVGTADGRHARRVRDRCRPSAWRPALALAPIWRRLEHRSDVGLAIG